MDEHSQLTNNTPDYHPGLINMPADAPEERAESGHRKMMEKAEREKLRKPITVSRQENAGSEWGFPSSSYPGNETGK